MDMAEIEAFFGTFLAAGPQILQDAMTGEGGLQKIVKIGGDVLQGLQLFHNAIASHPAVQNAPAVTP